METLMPCDCRQRARLLIDQQMLAGIKPRDDRWLQSHISRCAECGGYARLSARVLSGLNSFSFETDPAMTVRVQNAVFIYAQSAVSGQRQFRTAGWRLTQIVALAVILLAISICLNVGSTWHEADTEKTDAILLERVSAGVSRPVPLAMEPLLERNDQSAHGETR